jgi:hypothetical protein
MPRFSQLALLAVVAATTAVVSDAFAVVPRATSVTSFQTSSLSRSLPVLCLSDESKESAEAAVFMPPTADADDDEDNEVDLDTVEGLGRGAAKVRLLVVRYCNTIATSINSRPRTPERLDSIAQK